MGSPLTKETRSGKLTCVKWYLQIILPVDLELYFLVLILWSDIYFNTSPHFEFLANKTSGVSVCAHMYISVCVCVSVSVRVSDIPAGWQVDKGEDVVLDEAGETQEDRVEKETHETQALVQRPLVEVNSHDLDRHAERQTRRCVIDYLHLFLSKQSFTVLSVLIISSRKFQKSFAAALKF